MADRNMHYGGCQRARRSRCGRRRPRRGLDELGKRERGEAPLGIVERTGRLVADGAMGCAEGDEHAIVGAPVAGRPAAAPGGAREPAEKAAREPHPDLVAALGAAPLDDAERGERGGSRQGPSGRGLVAADGVREIGARPVPSPEELLAGEQKEGVEPVAGARGPVDEDARGAHRRLRVEGHHAASLTGFIVKLHSPSQSAQMAAGS